MRPADGEYGSSFRGYIALVPEDDVLPVLEAQLDIVGGLASRVPAAKELYAYGPGKWSVREVLGHVNDVERVFSYRAMALSRFEQTPLPGFDENPYVEHAHFGSAPLRSHLDEFLFLRRANLEMLRRLDDAQWASVGTVDNRRLSVRAIVYAMAGHVRHHLSLLRDRYGIE